MCQWIIPPIAGMIEPAVAPEFYIEGIGAAELLDTAIRFYLVARQLPFDGPAIAQKIVSFKIVMPIANIAMCVGQLAQCMSDKPITPRGPRLVT